MSAESENYRQRAAFERDAAAKEKLPNRRALHIRSAEVWESLAHAIEDTEAKTIVNEAVKIAQKGPAAPINLEAREHHHPAHELASQREYRPEQGEPTADRKRQEEVPPASPQQTAPQRIVSSPYRILHRFRLPFVHDQDPGFMAMRPVKTGRPNRPSP